MADIGEPSQPLTQESLRQHDDEPIQCHICLDHGCTSVFTTLPCRHSFHSHCIRRWFYEKERESIVNEDVAMTCPMCRRPFEYLCGHPIQKYHIRPGVTIHEEEFHSPCPNWLPGPDDTHTDSDFSAVSNPSPSPSPPSPRSNVEESLQHTTQRLEAFEMLSESERGEIPD